MMEFLEFNSIYIVLFIALAVWVGIFLYMNSLDKRLNEIENELER